MDDTMQAQYFRPVDLASALDWLAANDARIAAGCTDLLASTSAQRLSGNVLDVTAIGELRGISRNDEHWRFGATTTWTDVIEADLPPAFDSLKLAAREVGSQQIQHAGTLAGNLCNASPAADGVPCWLTLDAQVEIVSNADTRRLPLGAFITGPRKTELARSELVSAILVPHRSCRGRSTFLKLGARKYLVISIAMVAVRLAVENGIIVDSAISVGSCSAVAARLSALENSLAGQSLNEIDLPDLGMLIQDDIDPIHDLRSDANARSNAAIELVQRCIASLGSDKVGDE
ncbi:MAG: FAD binding domain-containing protein [Pseudomonadota bacterium]